MEEKLPQPRLDFVLELAWCALAVCGCAGRQALPRPRKRLFTSSTPILLAKEALAAQRILYKPGYRFDLPADAPTEPLPEELLLVRGHGHVSWKPRQTVLEFLWLRRRGRAYEATRMRLLRDVGSYSTRYAPDTSALRCETAEIPRGDFELIMGSCDILRRARITPKPQPPFEQTGRDLRQVRTTSDFYVRVKLKDHASEYVGYYNGEDEARYLPLLAVRVILFDYSSRWRFEGADVTESVRGRLTPWCLSMGEKIGGRNEYWWVAERAIMLSGRLGDKRVLPLLRKCLEQPLTLPSAAGGTRYNRYPYHAVNALANLLQVDFRPKRVEDSDIGEAVEKYETLLHEMK